MMTVSECSPCDCPSCRSDSECVEKVLMNEEDYEVVMHEGHMDFVVNGTLHHPHNGHFDNHGVYDASANKPTKMYIKNIRGLL